MLLLLRCIITIAIIASAACIFVLQLASQVFDRVSYALSWWLLCGASLVAGLAQRLA